VDAVDLDLGALREEVFRQMRFGKPGDPSDQIRADGVSSVLKSSIHDKRRQAAAEEGIDDPDVQ